MRFTTEEIQEFVLESFDYYLEFSQDIRSQESDIIEILLNPEDFIDVIAEIHKHFKIKASAFEWEEIRSINDIIRLVERNLTS